jgi:endo-1,4-beta-xylanase
MDSPNINYLGELIDWAHENDMEFHCTENNIHDVIDGPCPEEEYAEVYENILSTILSKREGGVVSWSIWYLTDRPHFRMENRMLNCLWDKDYNPNKAYDRVQNLLMYPPKAD